MRKNKKKQSLLFLTLILLFLQGFFSRETNFHFCQFFSNFLKYFSSNFPLSHLYNIFAVYFSSNSSLLKSLSSTKFNFSCFLISTSSLSLNTATAFFTFSKSFSLSYISLSAINLFKYTKYSITPLIFLLFNIFSTPLLVSIHLYWFYFFYFLFLYLFSISYYLTKIHNQVNSYWSWQ